MTRQPHIVAICGSLADDSATRVALRDALTAASAAGARTTLIDLREYDLPPYDGDRSEPTDATALRETVRAADAVALGSPLYHGTISSPLKTALDYCRRGDFEGTTVGLLAVSGGDFPTPALQHLRSVARALSAWTLPLEVGIPNTADTVVDGSLVDDALRERVHKLGTELVAYAGVEEYPLNAAGPASALLAE